MKSEKEIVALAFQKTIEYREQLFPLGFIASFFSLLGTIWYLSYQGESLGFFSLEEFLAPFRSSEVFPLLAIGGILLLFLGWFFSSFLCRARICDHIQRNTIQEHQESIFSHFAPLISIAAAKRILSPFTFFTLFSFFMRQDHGSDLLSGILLIGGIMGSILLFFFSFTTPSIIIQNKGALGSILQSVHFVRKNTSRTFKIFIVFLLIELRILLNVFLIFGIPFFLAKSIGFFSFFLSGGIGTFLGISVTLFLLLLSAYLLGILFVFSEAIWTIAFLEFRSHEK